MAHLLLIFVTSLVVLAGVAGVARATLPLVPTHEIPTPSLELPNGIGHPMSPPAIVTPLRPPGDLPTTIVGGPGETNFGRERSWWERLWTDPNATFSGAVALFTAALVAVGAYQGRKLKQSVDASELSARAAQISAAIARSALIDLERPFVHIEISDAGLVFKRGAGESAITFTEGMVYHFHNFGRTPANLIEVRQKGAVIPRQCNGVVLPDPVDPQSESGQKLPIGAVVGSGKSRRHSYGIMVDIAPRMGEILAGISEIFFIGYVRYTDIFANKYVTGFCALYNREDSEVILIGDERYNYTKRE